MPRLAFSLLALALLPASQQRQIQGDTVPFVGCPGTGMAEASEPPQGKPRTVALNHGLAVGIAFYEGEGAPGVFAPRGWHCHVWSGSAGATLLVTPVSLDSTHFPLPRIRDQAVEIAIFDGGTSGRYEVEGYASLLFSRVAAKYIERVRSGDFEPGHEFERARFANDSVTYANRLLAQFITPANKTGLGTLGYLGPSHDAIRGIVVIDTTGDWDVSILRVRLGSNQRHLETAILRLARPCMHSIHGC
jgi:hypothetical protein